MIWFLIASFIVLAVLVIATLALAEQEDAVWLLALVPLFLVIVFLAVFSYNRALKYNAGKCARWSETTGIPTKYENIGFGDWQCFGKLNDKWLPIGNLRDIEGNG